MDKNNIQITPQKQINFILENLERFSPHLITLLSIIGTIDPSMQLLAGVAISSIFAFAGLMPERTDELKQFFEDNKEQFAKEIIETENFRSIFQQFIEMYFRQNSEGKRKLLQNYLLNAGSKELPKEDYQGKIFWVLGQITSKELLFFNRLDEKKRVIQFNKKETSIAGQIESYGLIMLTIKTVTRVDESDSYYQYNATTDFGKVFLEYVSKKPI